MPTAASRLAARVSPATASLGGAVVFVDASLGDDTTGARGNAGLPFATILAAEAEALSGDVIEITAGEYSDFDLGKDGLVYNFQPGARIVSDCVEGEGIFDDGGAVMSFSVLGSGRFILDVPDPVEEMAGAALLLSAASTVFFQAREAIGESSGVIKLTAGTVELDVGKIETTASGSAIGIEGAGVVLTGRVGEAISTNGSALYVAGGEVRLTVGARLYSEDGECVAIDAGACDIVAPLIEGDGTVECVNFQGGALTITCPTIRAVNSSTGTVRIAGAAAGTLRLAGSLISNTHATTGAVNFEGATAHAKAVVLQNCALVSGAAVSVSAAVARNLKLYGHCMANVAKHANVTLLCGTLEVDADVAA